MSLSSLSTLMLFVIWFYLFLSAGDGRRRAPPHLEAPDPQLPPEVPQLRNEVGGEHEESQESTRSTSLLIRRNQQSIKFLIDPHCLDAPSTKDMQRALPNLKEFQRIVLPVAPISGYPIIIHSSKGTKAII